jgi:hypothetical protein
LGICSEETAYLSALQVAIVLLASIGFGHWFSTFLPSSRLGKRASAMMAPFFAASQPPFVALTLTSFPLSFCRALGYISQDHYVTLGQVSDQYCCSHLWILPDFKVL